MTALLSALSAILLAAGAAGVHAQMVKCVDGRGVVHYTDKPRPGCKGGEVDIRGQPPISGRLQPRNPDPSQEEREFQRRRIQGERKDQADAQARDQRQRRCSSMHAELQHLGVQRRVASVNKQGERVYLDDGLREQRMEQLRAAIGRECP